MHDARCYRQFQAIPRYLVAVLLGIVLFEDCPTLHSVARPLLLLLQLESAVRTKWWPTTPGDVLTTTGAGGPA